MQLNSQAFLYLGNGEIVPVSPENKKSFTLKELKGFVTGHIEILTLSDGRIMILDEEGKLKNSPINNLATYLATDVLRSGDYIVGDVLVTPYALVDY